MDVTCSVCDATIEGLSCARCGDAALLDIVRSTADPERKRLAQQRLVQLGSLAAARAMLADRHDDVLSLIREVTRGAGPATTILPMLLRAVARAPSATISRAGDLLRQWSRAAVDDDAAIAIAHFVRDHHAVMSLRQAFDLVEWGLTDREQWLRPAGTVTAAFTEAGATVLLAVTAATLTDAQWSGGWHRVVAQAATDVHAAAASRYLLDDPETGSFLLHAWFNNSADWRRAGHEDHLRSLVSWAWIHGRDRAAVATALAHATARTSAHGGGPVMVAWVVDRLCSHPEERAALYRGFRSWSSALFEHLPTVPASQRPGGGAAIDHLAVWGALDPERLSTTIDEAIRLSRTNDWPGLATTVFAIVDGCGPDELISCLVGAGRIGHELRNRVCDRRERDDIDPSVETAARQWIEQARGHCQRLRDDGRMLDRDVSRRVEDFEDSLAMFEREYQRRADDDAERTREVEDQRRRDAEHAAQVADNQRRQAEAMAAAEQMRQQMLAQQQAALAQRDAMLAALTSPSVTSGGVLTPQAPIEPIDREPFFAHLPLPTLLDYTRAMVRIQRGADIMALFAELGLDATSWSTCVQAWSMLFSGRPDLAQRFAALLGATWA